MMSERYEKEQAELEQSIAQMEQELSTLHSDEANVDRFIELCRRYTDLSELTIPMLNEYVDKILVHEAEKIDGERSQEVVVYLNYIGKFEPPEPELTRRSWRRWRRTRSGEPSSGNTAKRTGSASGSKRPRSRYRTSRMTLLELALRFPF